MDLEQLWAGVLNDIELQISRPNFVTWLKNSRLINEEDGIALVALPNTFTREWVQNKYQKLILGSLRNRKDNIKGVNFVVNPTIIAPNNQIKPSENAAKSPNSDQLVFDELKIDQETNLNPKYTLRSFIVGRTNELAHAAAMAVVDAPGNKYNPLFIYGGVGLGKTHLIQGIGNEIKQKHQNKIKVRYVTSEKFTNDVISAMKNRRMEDIKDKYRNIDVLIIDDIQFIGGKPATEEEFFHTFNALHQNNKQIIISSDRSPQNMPVLEDRLRSRFQGGMIADIGVPDYELRMAVLRNKVLEKNITLPDEILELIALKVNRSLRDLEGILNRLVFYHQTRKNEINKGFVEQIIDETIGAPLKNVSPDAIIKAVADHFQIQITDLTNKGRRKEIIEPRQIAVFLLREILDLSYPAIGDKLGKRDHTTAIYAYNKINQELTKNSALNQKINIIKETIVK